MSAEVPDPKTIKSWGDAFRYPVPAVRRMEQQLRSDISSNKERLRTLVGASYRDLLGTADSIIEMDSQMQQVESYLATMGMKCNARLLERSGVNLLQLGKEASLKDRTRYSAASQLSVFRSCPTVILRLLRKRGSVLLAAKVLVISRLLHKKLSGANVHHDKLAFIEGIRSKLAKLRQKLLDNIDIVVRSLDTGKTALTEAICAFALATSSSARDILRYFHHLRAEAIIAHVQDRQSRHAVDSMLAAMRLWIGSIQETHAIFPKHLSATLKRLKATPLFTGDDVKEIVELNQDIHREWIGNDIRNFTPYMRHDDLDDEAVEKLLGTWASVTLERYLQRVHALLNGIEDCDAVVQLRKRTLDLLFTSHGHVAGVDKRQALNSLRDAFIERLLDIAQKRCCAMENVMQTIRATLHFWERDPPNISLNLWDKSLTTLDTSHGARAFIDALKARVHGTSTASKRILLQYQNWLQDVRDFENVIEKMRKSKWEEDDDDDLVAGYDNDSLNDFDARQNLLSFVDPESLAKGLVALTGNAVMVMQSAIDEMVQNLEDPDVAAKAAFIIRLLRDSWDINHDGLNVSIPALHCSSNSLLHLYDILATHVSELSLQMCKSSVTRSLTRQDFPQRALWEENPELPVLPSPWTFRVLQSLVKEMGGLGIDIWSKGAVARVKTIMRKELGGLLTELLETERSEADILKDAVPERNGDDEEANAETEEGKDRRDGKALEHCNGPISDTKVSIKKIEMAEYRDRSIQLVFDMAYLLQATSLPTTKSSCHAPSRASTDEADALSIYHDQVLLRFSLDSKEEKRIEAGAAEYWKRTSLLFALLS